MARFPTLILSLFTLLYTACSQPTPAPQQTVPKVPRLEDLTYPLDASTIYWPNNQPFRHERVAFGRAEAGYWYASFNFSASEHGGTHMDAPIHFAEGKHSVDQIPISQHIGPGIKISIVEQAARDRDYRLTAANIRAWEQQHGPIPADAIVLIETGWGQYWGNRAQYLGSEKSDDASDLHFPGIAQDAAELLAKERKVAMVGIDTASLDYGPSRDFIAHQILNGANMAGLENVANLAALPEKGFLVLALPMKIAGGSGAPCRIVALLDP
ncbi:MAG: cyclase family protein [Acidobacteria bacterium]|nr:cyclase family protein [Acidobacteriota bacterium]